MRSSSNQTLQTAALLFTLLFCFFAVPVFAQDVSNGNASNSNSIWGKLYEYAIKVIKWGWDLISKHYQAIWNFFVNNIWPSVLKIGKAIFNALFNKNGANTPA